MSATSQASAETSPGRGPCRNDHPTTAQGVAADGRRRDGQGLWRLSGGRDLRGEPHRRWGSRPLYGQLLGSGAGPASRRRGWSRWGRQVREPAQVGSGCGLAPRHHGSAHQNSVAARRQPSPQEWSPHSTQVRRWRARFREPRRCDWCGYCQRSAPRSGPDVGPGVARSAADPRPGEHPAQNAPDLVEHRLIADQRRRQLGSPSRRGRRHGSAAGLEQLDRQESCAAATGELVVEDLAVALSLTSSMP